MQTITLNGKEYRLAYTMATAIAYERLTGKSALDLAQFAPDDKGHINLEAILDLALCMLISSNDDDIITDKGAFLQSISSAEQMNELITKTAFAINAFFTPQKGDKQPADTQAPAEGDAPKNA